MNRELKRKFNEYNRKWFDSRLPRDTVVDWHYDLPCYVLGGCHVHGVTRCDQIPTSYGKCGGTSLILLNTSIYDLRTVRDATLIHEMVHLSAVLGNKNVAKSHGKDFTNEMRVLAAHGAFDKLW